MDLFDVAKACVRRWYVFLPALLLVGWFSYTTYNAAKPVYYGTAVIGFSSPSSRVDSVAQGEAVSRNGLMDFGGSSLVANMTALALRQPDVIEQVASEGGSRGYVTKIFDVEGSVQQLPLVKIEVTDPSFQKVDRTLQLLVAQSSTTLRALQEQAQVPGDRMVSAVVVSPPSAPAAGMPTRTRSTVSIVAVGAALAVVLAVLFDAFLRRFQAKRRRSKTVPAAEPDRSATSEPSPSPATDRTTGSPSPADGALSGR